MKVKGLMLCFIFLVSCQEKEDVRISPEADAFLKEFLQIVENDYFEGIGLTYKLNKVNIDRDLNLMMRGTKSIEDTYQVIDEVMDRIGDQGGYLINSKGEIVAGDKDAFDCINHPPNVPDFPPNIAYISVQSNTLNPQEIAATIQGQIRSQILEGKDSWIIDLRNLGSGSFEGMLAGLGPLLGDGVVGSFYFNDQKIENWEYRNGASYINGIQKVVVQDALGSITPLNKIAVLIDMSTCRVGEQLALSLIKRPNTSFFGHASRGRAFLEAQTTMSNGHTLFYIQGALLDREKVLIGSFMLHPDGYSQSTVNFEEVFEWLGSED